MANRPSMIAIISAAYADLARVLNALWAPAIMALCLFIAAQFSALAAAKLLGETALAKIMLKQAIDLAGYALIAPFLIALHRFILLDEATQRYEFTTAWPRVSRFAGWLVLIGLITSIPLVIQMINFVSQPSIVYYTGATPPAPVDVISRPATLVVSVLALLATARLMILLPAIAIDARGATLANALSDTNGNVSYLARVSFLCAVSLLLPLGLFLLILHHVLRDFATWQVVYLALTIVRFFAIALAAALASRLLLALGNRTAAA